MGKQFELVLLGAGSSKRFESKEEKTQLNKILMPLNKRPVFDYSLRLFLEDNRFKKIWFVIKKEEQKTIEKELVQLYGDVPSKINWVWGGQERQDSVKNALDKINESHIMIHDAARPFLTPKLINQLIKEFGEWDAVTLGIPAKDTMKMIRDDSLVDYSLSRPKLRRIQTPQLFTKEIILKAMGKAVADQFYGNEEGELVERLGYPVKVVQGHDQNFKITTDFDFQVAKFLTEKK